MLFGTVNELRFERNFAPRGKLCCHRGTVIPYSSLLSTRSCFARFFQGSPCIVPSDPIKYVTQKNHQQIIQSWNYSYTIMVFLRARFVLSQKRNRNIFSSQDETYHKSNLAMNHFLPCKNKHLFILHFKCTVKKIIKHCFELFKHF